MFLLDNQYGARAFHSHCGTENINKSKLPRAWLRLAITCLQVLDVPAIVELLQQALQGISAFRICRYLSWGSSFCRSCQLSLSPMVLDLSANATVIIASCLGLLVY